MASEPESRTGPATPDPDGSITAEALAQEMGLSFDELLPTLRRLGIRRPAPGTRFAVAPAEQIRRFISNDRVILAEVDRLLPTDLTGRPPFVEVTARHVPAFMRLPGVEAVATSQDARGRPFIRVYLTGPANGRTDIARHVEGYPVLVQDGVGTIVPAVIRTEGGERS